MTDPRRFLVEPFLEAVRSEALLVDPAERDAFKALEKSIRSDLDHRPYLQLLRGEPGIARVEERRSRRTFTPGPVRFEAVSHLLDHLCAFGNRRRYASAGGAYPVQVYLQAAAVEGVPIGTYYHHPIEHRLLNITQGVGIDPVLHFPANRALARQAAFALYLVTDHRAIEPLYGKKARDFALIETGLISHLLESVSASHGIGLCQIGLLRTEPIAAQLELGPSHALLHTILGGALPGGLPTIAAATASPVPRRPPRAEAPPPDLVARVERVFTEVLNRDEIARDANWFDVGGTSLLAVEATHRLNEAFPGVELDVAELVIHPTIDGLSRLLAARRTGLPQGAIAPVNVRVPSARRKVAVIGLAGRFPDAPDADAYWRILEEGRCAVGPVPEARRALIPAFSPRPDQRFIGGYLSDIEAFDPQMFSIPPREAKKNDPAQRLMLEACAEALANAGYGGRRLAGSRTGVFVGGSRSEYGLLFVDRPPEADLTRLLSGNMDAILANRISHVFDLRGPSVSVDTACSSSLVAVDQAVRSLLNGDCDQAIAGGVNLLLSPFGFEAYRQDGMESASGLCRTFDAGADGFVRGEGVGAVLLKPLEDALADGDHIRAVILGTATNHGGRTNALSVPSAVAQAEVIRKALDRADLTATDIDYVEAHGTGTKLGDPIEIRGLESALEGATEIGVGSVKTNIGHLEHAAGIAALIKVILSLEKESLPPSLHFQTPNPHIRFDASPFFVVDQTRAWRRGPRARRAGVSSFGVGGTNAHVILEEAPRRATLPEKKRTDPILCLSARTERGLAAYARRFANALDEERFAVAAHTANTGRPHLAWRVAVRSKAELLTARPVQAGRPPRIGFWFAPEGSEHAGMGKALYEAEPAFRSALDRACETLGGDLLEIILRDEHRLQEPAWRRPALIALQWALAEALRTAGVVCSVARGSGIGAAVAACVAGDVDLHGVLAFATEGKAERYSVDLDRAERDLSVRGLGADVLVEIGPHPVLSPRIPGVLPTLRRDGSAFMETLRELYLRGAELDWVAFDQGHRFQKVALPGYPFERSRHWVDVAPRSTRVPTYRIERRPIQLDGYLPEKPAVLRADPKNLDDLLRDVDRLLAALREKPARLVLVTRSAALKAVLRTARWEHPSLKLSVVDFEGEESELDDLLVRETVEVELEVRDRTVRAPRIVPFQVPEGDLQLDPSGAYVVFGGKGGVGKILVEWLRAKGAGEVLALGHEDADVTDSAAVQRICDDLPNLRGVILAAGRLDDGVLANQTTDRFRAVLAPKVLGARNLDRATRERDLHFFVLVSSITGVFGSPGQGSYAAANAFLETVAADRRSAGLPGLAVAYGPWDDVGMTARMDPRSKSRIEARGIRWLSPKTAVEALEGLLAMGSAAPPLAVAADFDVPEADRTADGAFPLGAPGESRPRPARSRPPDQRARTDKLRQQVARTDDRPEAIEAYLREEFGRALGLEAKDVDASASVHDLGFDSLSIMEVIDRVQKDLGVLLYPREIYARPSIDKLAPYLAEEIPEAPTEAPHTGTDPVFLLSAPRSGSTLLRVMLAGHPDLFAPPELHLLGFADMGERREALAGTHLDEGLIRALMELEGLSAEKARNEADELAERRTPIEDVYRRLTERSGRTLIDKSPTYAADPKALSRALELFPEARFIHLMRHPAAVSESFVRMRLHRLLGVSDEKPARLAERIWRESNLNVRALPTARVHRLEYESLVTSPESEMRRLCRFLEVPFSEAVLKPYEGDRMTEGLSERSLPIGDVNFDKHDRIDPELAEVPDVSLSEETRKVMAELGYSNAGGYQERFVEVAGLRICVCTWGDPKDPPLLILHGALDQAATWDPVARRMNGRYVIAPDLRGHGRSAHARGDTYYHLTDLVADGLHLIRALSLPRLPIVGHSMGAMIAALMAGVRPVASSLVLVEPPTGGSPDPKSELEAFLAAAESPATHASFESVEEAAKMLMTGMPGLTRAFALRLATRATERAEGGVRWRWDPRLRQRAGLAFADAAVWTFPSVLESMDPPPAVIASERSVDAHPGSVRLPGGHNLHVDCPDALAASIREAIEG